MVSLNPQFAPMELGDCSITQGILFQFGDGDQVVAVSKVKPILDRFVAHDWGEGVGKADWQANEDDLKSGGPCRLLGIYFLQDLAGKSTKVYIVHNPAFEESTAQTTVLLPEEY